MRSPIIPITVLVVDNDSAHLSALDQILCSFGYRVLKFNNPQVALSALKTRSFDIDIILCGVPLMNIHAFELVRIAEKEFNIAVVVMISNPTDEDVFRGLLIGACQCVAKPVTDPQTLKDIWQHVVRKRKDQLIANLYNDKIQGNRNASSSQVSPEMGQKAIAAAAHGGVPNCSYNPKALKRGGPSSFHGRKKSRFIWDGEPRQIFLDAIAAIPYDEKVIPTRILKYMISKGVEISRENIASHLQKYRMRHQKCNKNNVVDKDSSSLDETAEVRVEKNLSSEDETRAIPKSVGSCSSTANFHPPSESLTTEPAPPNNQPNFNDLIHDPLNEITFPLQDTNMPSIDWDELGLESLKALDWMTDSAPYQEENKFCSSIVSNTDEGFDGNGNDIVPHRDDSTANSAKDLSNQDVLNQYNLYLDNEEDFFFGKTH